MFETSIQYWIVAQNSGFGHEPSRTRHNNRHTDYHVTRRSSVLRTIRTLSDAVLGGLIEGFMSPRLDYRGLAKPA